MVKSGNNKTKIKLFKKLYPEQKAVVKDVIYGESSFITVKAGRQAGKSFVMDRIGIYLGISTIKKDIIWVTPSHAQSMDAFERIENIIGDKIDGVTYLRGAQNKVINFPDGSRIRFFSAERYDNLRGKHPDYVILDEFAFFKEGAFEYAIKPYFIANKKLKVITASTPNGKNDFYDNWNKGEDVMRNDYSNHILHYSMNPKSNLKFIKQEENELPPQIFKQEYEGEFIFGTSSVFGEFIKNQIVNKWEEPIKGKKYFYGIDWATGDGQDKTVLTIIDEDGKVCLIHELYNMDEREQVFKVCSIINSYGAVGYSENNGIGHTINTLLINRFSSWGKQNIVYKYNTTQDNKAQNVQNLILDLNNNEIKLPNLNLCPKLDSELTTYQVKKSKNGKLSYSHSAGRHDDYVDSLILANRARIKLSESRIRLPKSELDKPIKTGVFQKSINDNSNNTHVRIPTLEKKKIRRTKKNKPKGGIFN